MSTDNTAELVSMVALVYKLKNTPIEPEVLDAWVNILSGYEMTRIRTALNLYIRGKTFKPDIAEVLELMGEQPRLPNCAWPNPEEAWNLLPKTEEEGGWMCQEMATAMGACLDSLDAGDRIAARMAFLEVYKREVRGKTGEPKWWLSEPTTLDHEARLHWKQAMFALKPEVNPQLGVDIVQQLKAEAGIQRSGSGLVKVQQ